MTVSDNGAGIPAENLTKIFEPFFSTKIVPSTDGGGLGIGLASIKNITEKDFQGKIFVASRLNQGTIFAVCFPLLDN
jgi:signal transduction histidine kinase